MMLLRLLKLSSNDTFAWVCGLLCMLSLAQTQAQTDTRIQAIEITGNELTQERIILQEMRLALGDRATEDAVEQDRQSILNLGLFSRVLANLSPDGVLHIKVKEKFYYLLFPEVNQEEDGEFSYSAYAGHDNLAGLNQRMSVRYTTRNNEDFPEGDRDEEYSLGYSYPRIGGSRYRLSLSLSSSQRNEKVFSCAEGVRECFFSPIMDQPPVIESRYETNIDRANTSVSRWLGPPGPSRGWQVGVGLTAQDRQYELRDGRAGLLTSGNTVALTGFIQNIQINDYVLSLSGFNYFYSLEVGLRELGSDVSFNRHFISYSGYQHLGRPHYNLNTRFQIAATSKTILNSLAYSLGNSTTLRGYDNINGNAYIFASVEYLQPLFGKNYFRGAVFADVGNSYAQTEDIDVQDVLSSVGVGLRFKVRSFVNLEFRLDYAYAIDNEEYQLYAVSSAGF